MAIEHQFSLPAHYNIYTESQEPRNLQVYFTEPSNGINENTGILITIPGFGGNAQSKVYKKMRLQFADKYNLVVIQCDYFGNAYMQKAKEVRLAEKEMDALKQKLPDKHKDLLEKEGLTEHVLEVLSHTLPALLVTEVMDENVHSFNDMGFMQALDILSSFYAVRAILKDNGLSFNEHKVIAYGHSHGAYLAYLCNRMAPQLFSLIIDNSAWLKPVYIETPRFLVQEIAGLKLYIKFPYFANTFQYDKAVLNLTTLYKGFNNNANIICYQGISDELVNMNDKRRFCDSIAHCQFRLIDNSKVDHSTFYSTGHGLHADFIKLFECVMGENTVTFEKKPFKHRGKIVIQSSKKNYVIDYANDLPIMHVLNA
ncbi:MULTISPECIES: DUF2920 family protein [unclassified Virgibacillus]|uniref:DUF2920 family protein n=1 Tax=unclassified Virgibacillus TaxID=2620237 RepID=UPI0024DE1816|nr:DUF2920 family protein [Virgibacillus sp. LDC-1]